MLPRAALKKVHVHCVRGQVVNRFIPISIRGACTCTCTYNRVSMCVLSK